MMFFVNILFHANEEKEMSKKTTSKKKTTKKESKKKRGSNKVRDGKASKAKNPYPPFKDKKNIGNYSKNMILRGEATSVIIEKVVGKFPDSKINSTAVSYYRAALEKEGFSVPAAS